jgi:hypothetical protein
MDIYINSKPFETAFSDYIEKKAKPDIAKELNRRAANIIMNAMAMTQRADPDSVADDLGAYAVVERKRFKKGVKAGQLHKKATTTYRDKEAGKIFKILNYRRRFRADSLPKRLQGAPSGNIKMKGFATKFVKSVKSSCGYIAAGWIPALKVFLTASKGGVLKSNDASQSLQQRFKNIANNKFAKMGYGNPAVPSDVILKCTFGNAARGANKIAKEPLIKAINREIADMKVYIEGKIMGMSGKEIERLNKLQSYMNLFGSK